MVRTSRLTWQSVDTVITFAAADARRSGATSADRIDGYEL
jgi:hypothetical protein